MGEESDGMRSEGDLPLPVVGLAGAVAFAFYWAREFRAEIGWRFPEPLSRPYATLWLILEGELWVDSGEGSLVCGPGALVCWPPGAVRKAENRGAGEVFLYTVAFNLQVLGELDFFRLYQVPAVHQVGEVKGLEEACAALVAELKGHRNAVTLVAEGWARVLVGRWLESVEAAGELKAAAGREERLSEALAAIEGDLSGEWSLQRLAGMMCLSKVRVREVFVKAVGLPPMRYVTMRRIAHAQRLLVETELTAGEVAERCGFGDAGYFSRMFHRIAGMTPVRWREEGKERFTGFEG